MNILIMEENQIMIFIRIESLPVPFSKDLTINIVTTFTSVIDNNCSTSGNTESDYNINHIINYQKSLLKELQDVLNLNTCSKEIILEYLEQESEAEPGIEDLRIAVSQLVNALKN